MTVQVKRRSWPQRFVRSYFGWRKHLGIVLSLRAAWIVSRTATRPDAIAPIPQTRLGRDWSDVSGGHLSEG